MQIMFAIFCNFFYELPLNLSNFSDCKSRCVARKNKKTNGEPLVFIEILYGELFNVLCGVIQERLNQSMPLRLGLELVSRS